MSPGPALPSLHPLCVPLLAAQGNVTNIRPLVCSSLRGKSLAAPGDRVYHNLACLRKAKLQVF